jgi:glycosyltransferase involved in cell wall biosynthesis
MTDRTAGNLRVCFVALSTYPYFAPDAPVTAGGAERQLYVLSQAFDPGLDVHFVVGDYGQARTLRHDGVTLHRAYVPDPTSGGAAQLRQFLALGRAMRRADADIYIYRGYPKKAAVVYALTRLLGAKWVYNVADDANLTRRPDTAGEPFETVFRRGLRDADGIISQTPAQQALLSDRFGVKSTVVPNGYPPTERVASRDEREYFLWVGRIDEEQKRPHLYLNLAERHPEATFRLVGPRDMTDSYHRRITEQAASLDNVEDVGGVPPRAVLDHYRKAIALVNTSSHEGFPNTFLEAWRVATPVVGHSVDPGRFLQDSSSPGYASGDFETLSSIVGQLSAEVEERARLGELGHRYFEDNLRIDQIAERYAQVLRVAFDTP